MVRRRYAALTMVRDEDVFLRLWHRYHAAEFGAENLFIIDHDSRSVDPRSVVGAGPSVLRLPMTDPVDDPAGAMRLFDAERLAFVSAQIQALLRFYDCVVFCDVDELFVPDAPGGPGLRAYLDSLDTIGLRAGIGLELCHDPASEPPLNPARPLFEQRRYVRYNLMGCKPWIVAERGVQITGHGARQPFWLDPNLLLIHLHHVDLDLLMARQRQRLADFAQGRGGEASRWKDSLPRTRKLLRNVADLPDGGTGLPHGEQLDAIFPGYRDRPFSADSYPRRRGPAQNLYVNNFVTDEQRRRLCAQRYRLPDRFVGRA